MPTTPRSPAHDDSGPSTKLSRRHFLQASAVLAGAATLPLFRPARAAASPSTAPVLFSQQVRGALPGEALLLAGWGFDPADQVSFWPVPDSGTITTAGPTALPSTPPAGSTTPVSPIAADADGLITELPSSIGGGAVAVYVSSADHTSWSAPLLLNAAQPYYLDRPKALAGQSITVYGVRLRSSTSSPTVQLETAGTLTSCSVTGSNNCATVFTVPAGTAAGTHRVYVSNGHGGDYGFDNSLVLTVVAAPSGTPAAINVVTGYGADPTGSADSTTSLQNALNAAAASATGAVVTVPAGTYLVTGKLSLAAGSGPVSIVGSSSATSKFLVNPSAGYSASVPTTTTYDVYGVGAGDDLGMLYLAPGSNPVTLDHLSFDANDRRLICLEVDGRNDVTVTNCTFTDTDWPSNIYLYSGSYGMIAQNCQGLTVANCQFTTASGVFLIAVIDTIIDTNTMLLAYPRAKGSTGANANGVDQDGIKAWGARRLTLRGNSFDRGSGGYYARAIQLGALKIPSNVFGAADAAGVELSYIGDNWVHNAGEPGSNCGESIVGDQFNSVTGGRVGLAVTAATATTVTTSGTPFATSDPQHDAVGGDVVVLSGTGAGQIRRVTANTSSQLTVDTPWDVTPATDSRIVLIVLLKRILYFNNTALACPKYLGNYGPGAFCTMAQNGIDTTGAVTPTPADARAAGIAVTGIVTGSNPDLDINFFNELVDNTHTGAHVYLQYDDFASSYTSAIPEAPLLRGNRTARNTASSTDATVELFTLYPPPAANVMGRHNLSVANVKGSSTTYNTLVGDAHWARSVYQAAAADLSDAGTSTIVV